MYPENDTIKIYTLDDFTMAMVKTVKSDYIRARIEPELKKNVHALLHEFGVSPTQVITMLYKLIRREHRLPFPIEIPNAETAKAIKEARAGIGVTRCKDANDMFKKLRI